MTAQALDNSYPALLARIQKEIDAGRVNIENARAATYWKIGKHINEDILKHKKRAGYGAKLFIKLARDLDVSKRTVEKAAQFQSEFPIAKPASQLSWAHYVDLLTVSNKIQRRQLENLALKEGLSRNALRKEIVSLKRKKRPAPRREVVAAAAAPVKLKPQKGTLHIYRVETAGQGVLSLDLGFNVTRRHQDKAGRKKSVADTLVQVSKHPDGFTIEDFSGTAKDLYFYKAQVTKVIDADTLWAKIDIGFDTLIRQKFRLCGLDAPEIGTPEGKKAKNFVRKALAKADHILVRTSTSDKYDRYLADIFYGPEETFLNQELLDQNLAVGYKK